MNVRMKITRRSLLKGLGFGTLALAFPMVFKSVRKGLGSVLCSDRLKHVSPVNRCLPDVPVARAFRGDQPARKHEVLWNKASFVESSGGLPRPSESVPLVIVGGGVSGLSTAYLLRDFKPILLEQAPRLGGNSQAESWNGIPYSVGAAYFMEQDEGTPIDLFYKDLGIYDLVRVKTDEDPVILNGKRYNGFWNGETDPRDPGQFRVLANHFQNVLQGEELIYPEIPTQSGEIRSRVNILDRQNFLQYVEGIVGAKLHPHLRSVIDHYCWSTFAAGIQEVSAAVGLNAFAAEFGKVYVAPGGNASVAERIFQRALDVVPIENFRTQALVFDVRVEGDEVWVSYLDETQKPKAIRAQSVVMACPKFVVKKIMDQLEPKRLRAMQDLKYRAYLVANVMVDAKVTDDFYDLFLLGDGQIHTENTEVLARKQKVTDVVLGTFARPREDKTVLTLYRGLPYEGGRASLFADSSFEDVYSEFAKQIEAEILPLLGIPVSRVKDIRIQRWGHPMPLPSVGLISSGTVDLLRAPFQERVFFIEQDNWMCAAIETGLSEALNFAPQIREVLNSARFLG
jgi:hypothetical protein